MSTILLVTGSRQLADAGEAAKEWAMSALLARIGALPSGSVVLSGGAAGPDTWAGEVADQVGLRWVYYLPSGIRLANYEAERRWSPIAVKPLKRNAALVGALVAARAAGFAVAALGLVHRAATTHGTEHTLGLAGRAGIAVTKLEWPPAP